ncbi:glycosyltransferase family 2 protein [Methylopila sp. M107]|uniref:glycosyltransferase family 2 protein n=1 Tax=Methylopila sp. M107 TaxID=1101190 RepID=UPI00035CBBDA|nr:glycosyltransferase family 2 protein [Methylopila sp. M107]
MHESARGFFPDEEARVETRVPPARPVNVEARAHQAHALPAELAALERAGLSPGPLYAAFAEATRTNVHPFDALLASGAFAEDELVAALARMLGVDVVGPEDASGPAIGDDCLELSAATGHLAAIDGSGEPRFVIAARGAAIARLALARKGRPRTSSIALAGPQAFADILIARSGAALVARACEGPARIAPELTVTHGLPSIGRAGRLAIAAGVLGLVAAAVLIDGVAAALLAAGGLSFAVMNGFRLWLSVTSAAIEETPPDGAARDADLPVYTVMVGLYREGAIIPSLLDCLERLDYPAAKLDIKILIEADDDETLAALKRRRPRAGIEVLTLPAGGPKTKPRALNAGLLCARGELITVYDAEDRPEPRQLRIAAETFRRSRPDLACLQARLAIDNHADGWLCRHFAIEYAALFDVLLPALAALGLPIPLGGTSNHFRVAALRRLGGWDAANVTEDADLGLRLARFGYRTKTICSVTWEEAPNQVWPWIKQRTRWMKGYMATAMVHGRSPVGLARALGPTRFVAAQLSVGGVALTALAYPVVVASILYCGLSGSLLAPSDSVLELALTGFHITNLIVGFSAGLACGWMGVDQRCPKALAGTLVSLPAYWLLVGFAAWRALIQILMADTTTWEKTTHGVSTRRATPPQT